MQLLVMGQNGWVWISELEVNEGRKEPSHPQKRQLIVLYLRKAKCEYSRKRKHNDHLYKTCTEVFFSRLRICTSNEYQLCIKLSHAKG